MQALSAGDIRGIREIMRIGGIGVAVELERHAAQSLEYLVDKDARAAVGGVEHDAQLFRPHVDSRNDVVNVGVAHVDLRIDARMGAFRRLVEQGKDLLDIVRLQGLGIAVGELKAGPAVRIVACRDHDRALAFQVILREIGERREGEPDVKYVDAFLQKRVDGGFCKRRRAGAVVVADDRAHDLSAAQIFGICFYDPVYVFGAKLLVAYSSADVVFAEHAAEGLRIFGICYHFLLLHAVCRTAKNFCGAGSSAVCGDEPLSFRTHYSI